MGKLTKAQHEALWKCQVAGRLWRNRDNLFRWLRTYSNGMVSKAAANSTVEVLIAKGLMARNGEHEVVCTPAGRAALASAQDSKG